MAAIKANLKPNVPLIIKRDLIHKPSNVPTGTKSLHVSGLLAANNTLQEGDLTKIVGLVRSSKCNEGRKIKGKENNNCLDAPLSTERVSTRIKAPPSTEVQLPSRQGSST